MSKYFGNGGAYNPPKGGTPSSTMGYIQQQGGGYYPQGGGYNPPTASYYPPASQSYIGQPAFPQPVQFPPPPAITTPLPRQTAPLANPGGGAVSTYPPLRQLLANDWVQVQLETRGWVLGVIVAVLKATNAITNWGYRVRYRPPNAQMEQERDFLSHQVKPTEE